MTEGTIHKTLAYNVCQKLGYIPSELDRRIREALDGQASKGGTPHDVSRLVDVLVDESTINHTELFRHAEQFRELEERLRAFKAATPKAALSIWSAGCATGEEVYSIAHLVRRLGLQATILATDISDTALTEAKAPSPRRAKRYQERGIADFIKLQEMIQFAKHSLVDPLPPELPQVFDFVFCRNVLIYFAPQDAKTILERVSSRVAVDGCVTVAPVESLLGAPDGFKPSGTLGVYTRSAERSYVHPETPPVVTDREPEHKEMQLLSDVLECEDPETSESRAQTMVSENPADPLAWFVLAELLLRRGETEQARSCYSKALGLADQQTTPVRSMLRTVLEGRLLHDGSSID